MAQISYIGVFRNFYEGTPILICYTLGNPSYEEYKAKEKKLFDHWAYSSKAKFRTTIPAALLMVVENFCGIFKIFTFILCDFHGNVIENAAVYTYIWTTKI